jgi:cytochrome c biogenesis protein CcmG, thiol:disulfide interchange protein DsbE
MRTDRHAASHGRGVAGQARPRARGLRRGGAVLALAVLAVAALVLAGRLVGPPPTTAALVVEGVAAVGRPAPRVELPGLRGGRVRLADLRGRPVVLNFWASWCPPCLAEMPEFQRVHRRLADRVAFLGVNQRDQARAAERLARSSGVTYPLAVDPAGRAFDAFGGLGMPTTVLIRADGTVADIFAGQLDETLLSERIRRVLGVA